MSSIQPILSTLSNITSASPASSNSNNNTTSNKLEIWIKQGITTFASDELTLSTRLITHDLLIKNYNYHAYTNTNTHDNKMQFDNRHNATKRLLETSYTNKHANT